MISRMDHVSIAVKDYDKAAHFFEQVLGAIPGAGGEEQRLQFHWRVFSLGDLTRLEIIDPLSEESFLDSFLSDKKDGGVHHITLETTDIRKARRILEKHGVPYFGFDETRAEWKELFIHPKDAFGVLIQIAAFDPDDYLDASVKVNAGRKWTAEKTENGVALALKHPGGGSVRIELDRDEAKDLISDLKKLIP